MVHVDNVSSRVPVCLCQALPKSCRSPIRGRCMSYEDDPSGWDSVLCSFWHLGRADHHRDPASWRCQWRGATNCLPKGLLVDDIVQVRCHRKSPCHQHSSSIQICSTCILSRDSPFSVPFWHYLFVWPTPQTSQRSRTSQNCQEFRSLGVSFCWENITRETALG